MNRKLLNVLVALFAVSATACTTIDSGEAGVLFRAFGGTEMDQVYGEGFHLIAPWNTMYVYDIKVRDSGGRLIAACNALVFRKGTPLPFL